MYIYIAYINKQFLRNHGKKGAWFNRYEPSELLMINLDIYKYIYDVGLYILVGNTLKGLAVTMVTHVDSKLNPCISC